MTAVNDLSNLLKTLSDPKGAERIISDLNAAKAAHEAAAVQSDIKTRELRDARRAHDARHIALDDRERAINETAAKLDARAAALDSQAGDIERKLRKHGDLVAQTEERNQVLNSRESDLANRERNLSKDKELFEKKRADAIASIRVNFDAAISSLGG